MTEVSFERYFLGDAGDAAANGQIRVNDNTFVWFP